MSELSAAGPGARILGLVLAGGEGRRLGGGDKTLAEVGGLAILDRILARLGPQVGALALSANGDRARFASRRLPVVPDLAPGQGPLGGILAGLRAASAILPGCRAILSVPGDAPFLPADLAARLLDAADGERPAIARSAGRDHPVVGLWPLTLADELEAFLSAGLRRAGDFACRAGAVAVAWPDAAGDPFLNVNTPEDLAAARARRP